MPITQDEFRDALSRFPSGITVVTTKDGAGKLHGITVSAFCSVSLEPPFVLICIEKTTASHYAFEESGIFVVNILNSQQAYLSEWFASQNLDKFAGVEFTIGEFGLPIITNCVASLECTLRSVCEGGDHSIFIGEVQSIITGGREPLVYFGSEYR